MRGIPCLSVVVLALGGCHTIIEEAPARSPLQNPIGVVNPGPIPVVPGPGASPSPTPSPSAPPAPAPTPEPSPTPAPTPPPNPIVRVTIKVLFVVCGGQGLPDSENMTTVPVGCKVHLDMNAKDANNKPVFTDAEPEWYYYPDDLVEVRPDTWTPFLIVKEAGTMVVRGRIERVWSNDLGLRFYNP